jgi:hyperosmotically inducible periplasmic protein
MKIKTSLTSLSVLLLVVGCNQKTNTTSMDETNKPVITQRELTNTLTPTSRETNRVNRVYPVDIEKTTDAEKAAAKEADNTGKNVRDRSGETLTPGDQGTTKEDVEITRNIRKAVMDKSALSTTAKNVKIITTNGKVTLRGPVNSPEEQQAIVSIAQGVAGVTSVDDQLEVKTNK